MKRFRLSTLLLLVVIAALVVALLVQQDRAAQREVALKQDFAKVFGVQKWSPRSAQKRISVETKPARLPSVVESAKALEGDEERE